MTEEQVGLPVSLPAEDVAREQRPLDGEPAPVPDAAEVKVPEALRSEIERAMARYPERRSASLPALWAVQRRYGWCSPEGIRQAAAVMGLTPAYLESIASFYDLFRTEPHGEHQVLVCTNISCWLRGGDRMLDAFERAAQGDGEASDAFVRGFECLGACDIAPMASIDERYFGPLQPGDAETALEQLRAGQPVLPEKALELRRAAGGDQVPDDERLSEHPLNEPTGPRPKGASEGPAASARKAAARSKQSSRPSGGERGEADG
jgi:NADH-quinone oxidoreductase subunit E